MGMPVLTPGPTISGFKLKYFRQSGSRMFSMGGTTQEMMMSRIFRELIRLVL